jgi:cobalt/nickel transport system permease protein
MWALIDHHLNIESPLRTWHPTAKLIGLGSLIFAAACAPDLQAAGVGLALAIFAVALTRFPPRLLWRRLRGLVLFVTVFAALIALTANGAPRWHLGPLGISEPGLVLGALLGAKALSIALLGAALVATTPFSQLCQSLQRLGCPARVTQVTLLAYRMSFALGSEVESTRWALSARGFSWRPSPRTLRALGHVLGSLLARSLDRADRLYDAMLARGYDGSVRCLPTARATAADGVAAVGVVLVAVGLIGMSWWL